MKTTAQVNLSITINIDQPWSEKACMKEVHEQAKKSALDELNRLAQKAHKRIKIAGEPKVSVITFDEN